MFDLTKEQVSVWREILIYHWRRTDSGCGCGWGELGHSWPDHLIEVFQVEAQHRRSGREICGRCGKAPVITVEGLPIDYCQSCYDEWTEYHAHNAQAQAVPDHPQFGSPEDES